MKHIPCSTALLCAAACLWAQIAWSASLPSTRPTSVGFSPERLERMQSVIQQHIDDGKYAGAISAVVRHGRIADFKVYGHRDLAAKKPMQRNTIVRIYSMSKVITSVAVLQLFEQGRFRLTDPVHRFIPQLKDLKVCTGGTPEAPVLVDAGPPITIKHLLTHTAGFAYEFSAKEPVKTLYGKANILESSSLKEFVNSLSKLPLTEHPGEAYQYGVSTDVLGHLVEVVSGQPLEQYMQEHIWGPLEMVDTSFDVAPEKMGRLAKIYQPTKEGKLEAIKDSRHGTYAEEGKTFPSGGGGMFSTADDYLRFAQMLLNGGKLEGKRVLGRKTVELMMVNHLTFLENPFIDNRQAHGFGLGGQILLDPAKDGTLGSQGLFGWNGAATTTFRIDPREQTVALLFTQHFPYDQHGIFDKFYTLFYASLAD